MIVSKCPPLPIAEIDDSLSLSHCPSTLSPYCKCLMAESTAMTLRWLRRTMVLIGLFVPLSGYGDAQARRVNDLAALRSQVSQLYGQGKYAEAIPIAERYVELARRRRGEKHM